MENRTTVSASSGKSWLRPAALLLRKTWVQGVHRTLTGSSMIIGLGALTAWFILFGLGILVDSKPFRLVNDPSFQQEVLSEATNAKAPESSLVRQARELSMSRVPAKKALQSFFLALCTYTPINLGLLCFWAGMLGGSASNLAYRRLQALGQVPLEPAEQTRRSEALLIAAGTQAGTELASSAGGTDRSGTDRSGTDRSGTDRSGTDRIQDVMQDTKTPQPADSAGLPNGNGQELNLKAHPAGASTQPVPDVRAFYLGEHPTAAAIRSFVVYLTLLAGFYLASGDPFKNVDANQYLRLAGIVSCLAFAIGYDPSRFTDILNSLPKAGGGKG